MIYFIERIKEEKMSTFIVFLNMLVYITTYEQNKRSTINADIRNNFCYRYIDTKESFKTSILKEIY